MSGSGKPLLGLWLYRSGEEWNYKEESPIVLTNQVPLKETSLSNESTTVQTEKISIIFTLKNQVGGLVRALQSFQDLGINVQHIESRPSQIGDNQVDFLVDVETDTKKLEQLGQMLKVGGISPFYINK